MGKGLAVMAPPVSELVSEVQDGRLPGPRRRTAVLIPTHGNRPALASHLERLAQQEGGEFDVLIIYGGTGRFAVAPKGLSAMHVREKGRLGCAGAYYLAERIALDEGYSTIIEGDDDCLPESGTLIADLSASAEQGNDMTFPLVRFGEGGEPGQSALPHYYGCFRRECFAKAGLTFPPLHMGGEDIELMDRMQKAGFNARHIGDVVSHPKMKPVLATAPERAYYYYRGEVEAALLSGHHCRALAANIAYLSLALSQLAFGNKHQARMMMEAMWDASGLVFFNKGGMGVKAGKEGMPAAATAADGRWQAGPDGRGAQGIAGIAASWAAGAACAGRQVVFRDWKGAHSLPAALVARSAAIEHEGTPHVIFRDRGAAGIAAGLLLMALAAPLVFPASVLLILRGAAVARTGWHGGGGYGHGPPLRNTMLKTRAHPRGPPVSDG